ncbi:MAG TPA: SDR family NAD(P)-dependent oxidoreductase [Nitrospiraceae bacterium]|nr:SDR family NAD(P)-dependent oxidoreductase [Nitrospiraceae bacterium]
MKRAFDICAAAPGLLITWPLLVIISVLIMLDSRGPVIFSQVRVGKGFRPFRIYKFRTMVAEAPGQGLPLTVGQDLRVTRVGRILRKFKLDELPQLVNVLMGDMSIVGPRPEVSRYVEPLRSEFSEILVVRPGLTDLASLKYIDEASLLAGSGNPEEEYRNKVLPEKLRLAKLYVRNVSLRLDLAIIVQTLLRIVNVSAEVCELPELKATPQPPSASSWALVSSVVIKWRRLIIILLDVAMIISANYLAFVLRFDGNISSEGIGHFQQTVLWLVGIRGVAFAVFGLHEGRRRYTSIWDLQNMVGGVLTSTIMFYGLVYMGLGLTGYPRSIFVIDGVLLVGFLAGVRLPFRIYRESSIYQKKKKVLVVGAGDSGERVVREMKTRSEYRRQPIGFVDDQLALVNQRIHGVRVLGTLGDLPELVEKHKPEEVVIALPDATPAYLRDLISKLEPYEVSIKTLPGVKELLADESAVSQLRNVSLPDLLPRAPVNMAIGATRQMVRGKSVLITGAGGSIGSELARQISLLEPHALLLYERHENSLYNIHKELEDQGFSFRVIPIIGDVTDARRLSMVLEEHRPQILFHAAAHKHVPLVELNPAEALKNNCIGTRITAEAASRYGVERFVHISTDKAVNPSSVMGATKRVAELIIQDIARTSLTRFLIVRFGNVLGSSGSVLLRFQEQIRAGGPVTVTHPDIERYFMLIPEAVQLVLQAATVAEQGGIYILDMGEQIKILSLAKNLIKLSGFVPGKDIHIRFVGLRPGEKLYEELVGQAEVAVSSSLNKILQIRASSPPSFEGFKEKLIALETVAYLDEPGVVIERLKEIIPTFRLSSDSATSIMPIVADAVDKEGAGLRVAGSKGILAS